MQPDILAKNIRQNLVKQKEKLESYLKILDTENEDIINNDADKLIAHINLEKDVISDLTSLKIILEPLEKMYMESPYKKDDNLLNLRKSIDLLSGKVTQKSEINMEKLNIQLTKIKADLSGIKSRS